MGALEFAMQKLEASNQELKNDLEQLGEQFQDLRADPRFEGFIDDLEDLAQSYLTTWISTNTQVMKMLEKK